MQLIECVPNISEGRNQIVIDKIVEVIEKDKRGYSALLVGYGHIKSSKVRFL